ERIRMIGEASTHDRHGLEAAVRMPRKPGHDFAVVHPPAVLALEVLADVAAGERRGRTHPVVARGVTVVVIGAEQERVDAFPRERERLRAQYDCIGHRVTSAAYRTAADMHSRLPSTKWSRGWTAAPTGEGLTVGAAVQPRPLRSSPAAQ